MKEDENKELLKIINSEENNEAIKDKMYRIAYEELELDNIDVDTDLIDECIKTVKMIDNVEDISSGKIEEMYKNIHFQYDEIDKKSRKSRLFTKQFIKIAASLIIIFSLIGLIADANGYNILKIITDWNDEQLFLNIKKDEEKLGETDSHVGGIIDSIIYYDIGEMIKDIEPKPILPTKVLEKYNLDHIERTDDSNTISLTLIYMNKEKQLIVYLDIYKDHSKKRSEKAIIEKDETPIEIYRKNNIDHYIMGNDGTLQSIWFYNNTKYLIVGDISVEEMKKIIDSLYNK